MLIVILLGYGLVAIPKSFWRDQDHTIRAKKLYSSINISYTKSKNTIVDLEDLTQVPLHKQVGYRNGAQQVPQ
jgi:hypothetical protein